MRFLLVEDNDDFAIAVRDRLALDGHAVDWAPDLEAARACLASTDYDMILLDITLPDGDGRELLDATRAASDKGGGAPVIVLTARSQVADRVLLLDAGADDYLTKPFDFAELEARCRAVLRRRRGGASNATTLGGVTFDPLAATLTIGDRVVPLRNRELRLFETLLAAPNRVYSKSHLIDRLFPFDEEASENAIEVYIGRLRKKLEGAELKIETVRGLGYRLKAP
ncbi:MAG: response regulator transcription factor [Neomegalonema sp.]|nr:response regulator transcription factor [Neomegalonema sp.]